MSRRKRGRCSLSSKTSLTRNSSTRSGPSSRRKNVNSSQVQLRHEVGAMAKNTGENFRKGSVDDRSQVLDPKNKKFVKRDLSSGEFADVKSDEKPFKGVAKEPDGRKKQHK